MIYDCSKCFKSTSHTSTTNERYVNVWTVWLLIKCCTNICKTNLVERVGGAYIHVGLDLNETDVKIQTEKFINSRAYHGYDI